MTTQTANSSTSRVHWSVKAFRIIAFAEAVSWGALLLAMVFKYAIVKNAAGVKIIGPIHGTMFLIYVVMTLVVGTRHQWSPKIILLGLGAAIPPFMTVVFEKWAERTGKLIAPVA